MAARLTDSLRLNIEVTRNASFERQVWAMGFGEGPACLT